MKSDVILNKIKEYGYMKSEKFYLSCSAAFKISNELGVELIEISKICNANKIKITTCQLGCFE